jgi:tetrahydromethanopterin S-methyltransferase subunit G
MADNNIREKLRDRTRSQSPRTERDLGELTTRLQHQVNELVERVTGIRQVKRQYLTLGLSVGVLIGVVLGVLIGMLMHSVTDGNNKD